MRKIDNSPRSDSNLMTTINKITTDLIISDLKDIRYEASLMDNRHYITEIVDRIQMLLARLTYVDPLRSPVAKTSKSEEPTTRELEIKPIMVESSTDMGLTVSDIELTRSWWDSKKSETTKKVAKLRLKKTTPSGNVDTSLKLVKGNHTPKLYRKSGRQMLILKASAQK